MAQELREFGDNTLKVVRYYLQHRVAVTHDRLNKAMREEDATKECALTDILGHLAREHALVRQELESRGGQE